MSNFRLNLPVDIPWKLIDSSADMMDRTFCDKKFPSPFKSSLAIYAWQPKAEELPEELCGDRITYLKVSCTIVGYQPSAEEKERIVSLLESAEVNYANWEEIVGEYLGCYGVLLNVAVHPVNPELKDDLDQYPRIVDFEPKTRDFYQAATETGEVLTTSFGRVSTNKSFGSTDTTQNSWNASADASIASEAMAKMTGVPVGIVAKGSTGQVRTETDQDNWSTATDASRERKETQATTTQLSQMYNLLTGYHTGSNRAAFIMLPRPHILQPTDRRTFVQGLRIIEGVQDFFLVVVRPSGQNQLKVDAHLQTGHFPEDVEIVQPSENAKFDRLSTTYTIEDSFTNKDTVSIIGDGYTSKKMSRKRHVVDVENGWEADPSKGDRGLGGVRQIANNTKVTISEIDTETGKVLGSHQESIPEESGEIEDVSYEVTGSDLLVTATLKLRRRNAAEVVLGSSAIARFSRAYEVFVRRSKLNAPTPVSDIGGLLITQRSLCVQISFDKCVSKVAIGSPVDDLDIVFESPFDIDDLLDIPFRVNNDKLEGSIHRKTPRFDFAFKKALLRKIQKTMMTACTSPMRYSPGTVDYLSSRHFLRRLLRVLPDKVLDQPLSEISFVDVEVRRGFALSLRELLSENQQALAKSKLSVPEVRALKAKLFRPSARVR